MDSKELLIAWLCDALKTRFITNPTPTDILLCIVGSEIITDLWNEVYGERSPEHIESRKLSWLTTQLIETLLLRNHFLDGVLIRDNAVDCLNKQRARDRAKSHRIEAKNLHWKCRENQATFYILDNPRSYGNG